MIQTPNGRSEAPVVNRAVPFWLSRLYGSESCLGSVIRVVCVVLRRDHYNNISRLDVGLNNCIGLREAATVIHALPLKAWVAGSGGGAPSSGGLLRMSLLFLFFKHRSQFVRFFLKLNT